MTKKFSSFLRVISGIADYDKESMLPGAVAWTRSVDYRSDPQNITILPRTVKESASVTVGLPKWADRVGTDTYFYDDGGNLYKRTSAGVHTLIRTVANAHGNGLAYYGEDDNLYYTTDKAIGRYGQFVGGAPTFADDFLASQGSIPTNTNAMTLLSASSQYLTAADSASLSIVGDLTLEMYVKPTTLPAVGSSMALISKWKEDGNERSYMFEIYGISGFFGDGSSSSLTISSNTTEAPIDSAATGTLDAYALAATNASFAVGQVILIHQTQGSGAGSYQMNKIIGYTAGTITLETKLNKTYVTGAQVRVVPQYTNVTINSGVTYSAKAWNGTVGGIFMFMANGTVSIVGNISASAKGFRGGVGGTGSTNNDATSGEGTIGIQAATYLANGNGGGGGHGKGGVGNNAAGGGGGGHASAGSNGTVIAPNNAAYGIGGDSAGSTDLTTMVLGGGGGGAGASSAVSGVSNGGIGGGIIFIIGTTISISGSVTANGGAASTNSAGGAAAAGGGAGGSVLLKCQTAVLGASLVTATGGSQATENGGGGAGGAGSVGRIHIDYLTSYTGTTSPTINAIQDPTLVTSTTYQLRLRLSSNGTNEEILSKNVDVVTRVHQHLAVKWTASSSTAEFLLNGVSQGSSVGALTSISNNASLLYIGAYRDGAGAAAGFLNGIIDEPRIWGVVRTNTQISNNKDYELAGSESGLKAYYQLDGSLSDSTANANNLTAVNSPAYTTDVPFFAPTARLDKDQEDTSSGNTYALGTSVDEGASHRQTFIPEKDPQKSIIVNISAKGTTADWTLVVHDQLNRVVVSKTVTNANLPSSGNYEFIFDSLWRPIRGASYHYHVYATNTTGTPALVSGTSNNLETAQFSSYYQFLVTDTEWHPIMPFTNMILVGNERYVATWNAITFAPHKLTFPANYRVRCFGVWNEYAAIGVQIGSSISSYDFGRIFFWDGISETYNFFIDVPEGAINAMIGSSGQLYFFAGYQGDLMVYEGGAKARKVKRIPKITKDKFVEIYPGAMTMWQTLLRVGVSGNSDSDVIEKMVYSYGSLNDQYPNSLSGDYPISTGRRLSTVKIGCVIPVDKKLLMGWQDGVAYGVDVVDPAGAPYPDATMEFLIQDEGQVSKGKMAQAIRADFEALNEGECVGLKMKIDRAENWTTLKEMATAGETTARENIDNGRHREYQIAIDLGTTVATAPKVYGFGIVEDILDEEEIR